MRHCAFGNGIGGVGIAGPLAPVLETDEGHTGVLPAAAETKTVDGENGANVGLLVGEKVIFYRVADRRCPGIGRAGRQGVLHHYHALIFIGQEAGRQPHIHHGGGDQ
ncbi:hypothetical protein D3C80_990320 [compost metagenome]